MRKTTLLATAMGAVLLAAAPVMAQPRGGAGSDHHGFTPPPGPSVTPHGHGGAGMIPPVGRQHDAARRVQSDSVSRDVGNLLRQAEMSLSRGNAGMANEYLERAETTLLNREPGPGAERSRLHGQISEARQALMHRDRNEAMRHVRMAMGMVNDPDMATGGSDMGMSGGAMDHGRSGAARQWPGTGGPVGDYSGRHYERQPGTQLQTPAYPSQQSGPAAGMR